MIGCISVNPVGFLWASLLRSPYRFDRDYFCMADKDGQPNYNSADNSNGVAPDFAIDRSITVAYMVNHDLCERRGISRDVNPKLPSDAHARTLLAWWKDLCSIPFHVYGQSSLAALYTTTVRRANYYDE